MYEKIPQELRQLNQWGCFHLEWVEARRKYTKIPIDPHNGRDGKSNDPSTWSDFDTAMEALDDYPQADGLAFYLANGYVGLDIDHIADELEKVSEGDQDPENYVNQAARLTKKTYLEISVSGTGIHAIFKGKIPGDRRRKGNFEMYEQGRFLALTGNSLNSEPVIQTLDEREMQTLYDTYFHEDKIVNFPKTDVPTVEPIDLPENEIINHALKSRTGDRFRIFLEGGWEQFYPSQSEADLAFANDLAFWTGKNFKKMDDIFRKSSLYRPKYDEKHGKTTYGVALLSKAINEAGNVFNPRDKPHLNYKFAEDFGGGKKKKVYGPFTWDDMGMANRFLTAAEDHFKYSFVDKRWYFYSDDLGYWSLDNRGEVQKFADYVVKKMADETPAVGGDVDPEEAEKKWAKFKSKERNNRSKENMLKEVQHHVAVLHNEFDRDAMLLNTRSGYVDLNRAVLQEHDKSKMFSKITAAEFTESIDAPVWNQFLEQIFDHDQELIHFIQKAVGYSITGSTREQVMFFLHGNGRNGKSVFINTIADVLGTYAETMNVSSIMVKSMGGVNSDIARLEGARMVISSEANEGERLDEGLVKQMTGGDKMVARHLYGSEFEFTPTLKLWMATNHRPLIRGTDDGIWRRIMLIPFKVQIPKEQVDKNLSFKLQAERDGILNWIVQGAMMWQNEGLEPPQIVREASLEYRNEMDVISLFIDECCEKGETYRAPAGELFKKYQEWAKESSEYSMSKQKFGKEMRKKFEYKKSNSRFYLGLKIKTDPRGNFLN